MKIQLQILIIIISIFFFSRCEKRDFERELKILTSQVTNIKENSAIGGGDIIDDGETEITSRGICWNTWGDPTINDQSTSNGTGKGAFTCTLTGLSWNNTYYVRAYAKNNLEIYYGDQVIFIIDIEGNGYQTVSIGTQVWMSENLKVTKYKNGTKIPLVKDKSVWINLSSPAYCWYNNDSVTYSETYGALYNWYVVNTDQLCPTGWHVPDNDEWLTLINYLEGESVAGGKLKEVRNIYWKAPNTDASNSSGFSARAAGYRSNLGGFFDYLYQKGYWWSTNDINTSSAYYYTLDYESAAIAKSSQIKTNGFSVRCVKD